MQWNPLSVDLYNTAVPKGTVMKLGCVQNNIAFFCLGTGNIFAWFCFVGEVLNWQIWTSYRVDCRAKHSLERSLDVFQAFLGIPRWPNIKEFISIVVEASACVPRDPTWLEIPFKKGLVLQSYFCRTVNAQYNQETRTKAGWTFLTWCLAQTHSFGSLSCPKKT